MASNFTFLKDETEEILDEIRKASKLGYSEKASIVDNLLNSGWCTERNLVFAYNELESIYTYDELLISNSERITVFFQLPFSLKLPENRWIKVRSGYGHPALAWSSIPFDTENLTNLNSAQSQIFISYELWEKRKEFYPLYLEGIQTGQKSIKTDLRSKGVWILEDFEHNLLYRLRLQTREVLKEFIPMYKVVCSDTMAFVPNDFPNFFIMLQNGRIVCKNLNEKVEVKNKPASYSKQSLERNLQAFNGRLKRNLPPNIYETYFLEVYRLIENERFDLAVVQTIVILDWFANEIIESHLISKYKRILSDDRLMLELVIEQIWESRSNSKDNHKKPEASQNKLENKEKTNEKKHKPPKIKVGTLDKFDKYFPIIGINLDANLLAQLKQIYDVRNEIVHRYKLNFVSKQTATEALKTGVAIMNYSMNYLLSRNSKK